jgi:hypothetical protein
LGSYEYKNEDSGYMHGINLTGMTVVFQRAGLLAYAHVTLLHIFVRTSQSSGYHVWFVLGRHGWLSVTDTLPAVCVGTQAYCEDEV